MFNVQFCRMKKAYIKLLDVIILLHMTLCDDIALSAFELQQNGKQHPGH